MIAPDKDPSYFRFLLETFCIVGIGYAVSIVPGISIGSVFDVTGSTGCMLVCYLLPSYFAYCLTKSHRGLVIAVGVCGSVFCLVSFYAMVQ